MNPFSPAIISSAEPMVNDSEQGNLDGFEGK